MTAPYSGREGFPIGERGNHYTGGTTQKTTEKPGTPLPPPGENMGKKEEKIARTVLQTIGRNLKARAWNWLSAGTDILGILKEGEEK